MRSEHAKGLAGQGTARNLGITRVFDCATVENTFREILQESGLEDDPRSDACLEVHESDLMLFSLSEICFNHILLHHSLGIEKGSVE